MLLKSTKSTVSTLLPFGRLLCFASQLQTEQADTGILKAFTLGMHTLCFLKIHYTEQGENLAKAWCPWLNGPQSLTNPVTLFDLRRDEGQPVVSLSVVP